MRTSRSWIVVVLPLAASLGCVGSVEDEARDALRGGGGGSGGRGAGAHCSVTPDPADVGEAYTIAASGLRKLTLHRVRIADGSGTRSFDVTTSSGGALALVESSDAAGAAAVSVYKVTGGGEQLATSCSFLVVGDSCVPVSCESAAAECGTIDDGCGGAISCGQCPSGFACASTHVCVASDAGAPDAGAGADGSPTDGGATDGGATDGGVADGSPTDGGVADGGVADGGATDGAGCPASCAAAGAECGVIDDGCGGTLDCGGCSGAYSTCTAEHLCACTPLTCADTYAECGAIADGCGGWLDCGGCTGSEFCGAHYQRCGTSCPSVPEYVCLYRSAECGTWPAGCGRVVDCGTCPAGQTCGGGGVPGRCSAEPCDGVECGPNATCRFGTCDCDPGYTGNPGAGCVSLGTCSSASTADNYSTLTISTGDGIGSGPIGSLFGFAVSTHDGGTAIVWRTDTDETRLTVVDHEGNRAFADVELPTWHFGLDVISLPWGGYGLIGKTTPGPDLRAVEFVEVSPGGAIANRFDVLPACNYYETGCEYVDSEGSLVWDGQRFYVFLQVHMLAGDGLRHLTDQLNAFTREGALEENAFHQTQLCGHNHSPWLTFNGTEVVATCHIEVGWNALRWKRERDIWYPSDDGDTLIYFDDSTYGRLPSGELLPTADGYWVDFAAARAVGTGWGDVDVALQFLPRDYVDGDALPAAHWLTSTSYRESAVHLALYEGGLLAGWNATGPSGSTQAHLLRVDTTGTPLGSPEALPVAFPLTLIPTYGGRAVFNYVDGDIGWVTKGTGQITVHRIAACH